MYKGFTESEWEQLSQYRINQEERVVIPPLSVRLSELMDPLVLDQFLREVSTHIGSPNKRVTASMLMKRVAFLAAAFMYSLTAFNKRMDFTLADVVLVTKQEDPLWLPSFYFSDLKTVLPSEDREKWRAEAIESFFGQFVQPLLEQVEIESKQSKLVLWENIAIYLFWLYESNLFLASDHDIQKRAQEDFAYLTQGARASLFGPYLVNPIQRHYHEKQFIPHLNEEVRVRTTCCFFYKLTNTSDRCKICPQTCKPNLTTKRGGKILEREVKRAVGRTAQ